LSGHGLDLAESIERIKAYPDVISVIYRHESIDNADNEDNET